MEKRHYFEIPDNLIISSINRVTSANKVTSFQINGVSYNLSLEDQYDLIFNIPPSEPMKGIIAEDNGSEIWTKDGLYLHRGGIGTSGNIKIYIKDFLELVPGDIQSKMLEGIMDDPVIMNNTALNLIKNTVTPKEFHIIFNGAGQHGNQDNIIAYVNNIYYVNSMNDYGPFSTDNIYGTNWAIVNTEYDPVATSNNQISNGIRKDMVLKSNKMIYLARYEDMNNDTTPYLQNDSLLYLSTIEVEGLWYQTYLNLKYVYDLSGSLVDPLSTSSWQSITISNAFLHDNLKGKILKVW